jgi:hypothetical protein
MLRKYIKKFGQIWQINVKRIFVQKLALNFQMERRFSRVLAVVLV